MAIKRLGGIVLGCLVALPLGAAGDTARVRETTLEAARAELRARVGAYERVHERYESLRGAGRLSPEELDDYDAYLLRLERLIAEQRRVVARLKGTGPAGASEMSSGEPRLGEDFSAGRTEAEKASGLDSQLGASLSEFDEMLLREQQELAAKTRPTDAGAEGSSGDGAEGREGRAGDGEGQGRGQSGETGEQGEDVAGAPTEGTAGGMPDEGAESAERAGDGAAGGETEADGERPGERSVADASGAEDRGSVGDRSAAPDDVPGGGDDDVVARQLREAAENEQDPELREKLWEEYRRYKSRGL